jgi:pyruvate dehydrogenase E1 component alpha subunit
MDVLNVYDAMKPLVDEVRETSRPAFVDMRTYRFKGHSMSDPRKYRPREEEEVYESGDPIAKLRDTLMTQGALDEAAFKALGKEIRFEVRDAMKWAEASPAPKPEDELYHDVYVEPWGPYTGTSEPQMIKECEGTPGQDG